MLKHKYINEDVLEKVLQNAAQKDWEQNHHRYAPITLDPDQYKKRWIDYNRMFFVHFLDDYLHQVAISNEYFR